MKKIDLVGRVFGRLTVTKELPSQKRTLNWLCLCSCGKKIEKTTGRLCNPNYKFFSCGCQPNHSRSSSKAKNDKQTYNSWASMKRRCDYPKYHSYNLYGGRGITYDKKWTYFEGFFEDMGRGGPGKTLERIDTNKNYTKENCKWATRLEQGNNKRNNHVVTFNGKSQTIMGWQRETGIAEATIRRRLSSGWSILEALTKEVKKTNI